MRRNFRVFFMSWTWHFTSSKLKKNRSTLFSIHSHKQNWYSPIDQHFRHYGGRTKKTVYAFYYEEGFSIWFDFSQQNGGISNSSRHIWRQNLAKVGELEGKALFTSFDRYSHQNVNNIVYNLIAKFDDFRIQLQVIQTRQNWRPAFACYVFPMISAGPSCEVICRCLSARLQYLHCLRTADNAVLY